MSDRRQLTMIWLSSKFKVLRSTKLGIIKEKRRIIKSNPRL
nr:MAG TPA: hypothetical protein [Bacteriophage sp.]DAY32710.1 MAG TPA: hypothetical protein [Caudoviricetes sp.]